MRNSPPLPWVAGPNGSREPTFQYGRLFEPSGVGFEIFQSDRESERNKATGSPVYSAVVCARNRTMRGTARLLARCLAVAAAVLLVHVGAAEGAPQAVVELFTSQGCSSCPPADALAGRLSHDSNFLVLSFHVNYWDSLGWRDPFASQASTDRQYAYARSIGESSVYTPQIVVNGAQSIVGSQQNAVTRAIEAARSVSFPVTAALTPGPDGAVWLTLEGSAVSGDVWEVRYVSHSVTQIRAGENGGHSLESFNDVTHIIRLGAYTPGRFKLGPLRGTDDGLAVIVQSSPARRILGAATYMASHP
jgi:hypothetical protein